jgi:hypothetical protein
MNNPHPEFARILKEHFPWRGTDEPANDADTIEELGQVYSRLTDGWDQLNQATDAALKELPEAEIQEDGQMHCRICDEIDNPTLVEIGYELRHQIVFIRPMEISARGGVDFGEEGTGYVLQCHHCCAPHKLPEGMEIDWE